MKEHGDLKIPMMKNPNRGKGDHQPGDAMSKGPKLLILLGLCVSFAFNLPYCGKGSGDESPPCGVGDQVVEGDYLIDEPGALANLIGKEGIQGKLTIRSESVVDLSGLVQLDCVGGHLEISETGLTNLNGLENLKGAGGNFKLEGNSALENIDALDSSFADVGGGLLIDDNAALANLDGLISLVNVGGYLNISDNVSLTNLNGLENLEVLGGEHICIMNNLV